MSEFVSYAAPKIDESKLMIEELENLIREALVYFGLDPEKSQPEEILLVFKTFVQNLEV